MNVNKAWKSDDIPDKQYGLVKKELQELRNGNPHEVWTTATNFLKTLDDHLTIIDVGCASGYFCEVFDILLPGKFKYVGGDFSEAMLKKARLSYPRVKFHSVDVRDIKFDDKSFDIAFSSACLEHIKDEWVIGLKELCRISKKYVILHKTPLTPDPTYYLERDIYGQNHVVFNKFNKGDFFDVVKKCGFKNIFDIGSHGKKIEEYRFLVFERVS